MTGAEPGATSPRLQLPANLATYRPLRSSSALAALTNLTTPCRFRVEGGDSRRPGRVNKLVNDLGCAC
jgi:hypothetical protein